MIKNQLKNQPLVSIIIPSYNSIYFVKKCLKSVLTTNYAKFEVIFIDDGSTDGSLEYVKENYGNDARVKLICNSKKLGLAASRNVGIRISKGKYLAFIETDMEVDKEWLNEALRVLESDNSIGAICCKVRDINRKDRLHTARVFLFPYTGWVLIEGLWEPDREQYDEIKDTMAGAVGLVVKKDVIDKIGMFDEQLTHNIDDIDFGWRIWIAGYRIVTAPRAIVYHYTFKPSSLREKVITKYTSEFHFNKALRMIFKNYEFRYLIIYFPLCFIIHLARAIVNLLKGDIIPLKAFFKANVWFLSKMRDNIKERYKVQATRRFSDHYILNRVAVKDIAFYLRYLRNIRALLLIRGM